MALNPEPKDTLDLADPHNQRAWIYGILNVQLETDVRDLGAVLESWLADMCPTEELALASLGWYLLPPELTPVTGSSSKLEGTNKEMFKILETKGREYHKVAATNLKNVLGTYLENQAYAEYITACNLLVLLHHRGLYKQSGIIARNLRRFGLDVDFETVYQEVLTQALRAARAYDSSKNLSFLGYTNNPKFRFKVYRRLNPEAGATPLTFKKFMAWRAEAADTLSSTEYATSESHIVTLMFIYATTLDTARTKLKKPQLTFKTSMLVDLCNELVSLLDQKDNELLKKNKLKNATWTGSIFALVMELKAYLTDYAQLMGSLEPQSVSLQDPLRHQQVRPSSEEEPVAYVGTAAQTLGEGAMPIEEQVELRLLEAEIERLLANADGFLTLPELETFKAWYYPETVDFNPKAISMLANRLGVSTTTARHRSIALIQKLRRSDRLKPFQDQV